MDMNAYERVYKLAMKDYRNKTMHGEWPYLWVLDEILSHTEVLKEEYLGLVDIPLNQIMGTKTEGRTQAFASNFMPLLPSDSEFAYKWAQLYESHMEEGIHDPIKAYEFMNKFYILEGNKRVSVLKAVDAITVPGTVTRIIPKKDDSEENAIYYEFLDFYEKTSINYIDFTKLGSYPALLEKMGVETAEDFTEEKKEQFQSDYVKFVTSFLKKGGDKLKPTLADAFLLYLELHDLEDMKHKTADEVQDELGKIWNDFVYFPNKPEVKLIMDAGQEDKRTSLVKKILPPVLNVAPLKVAFIHSKTAATSSWTYGHDLGANHLEEAFNHRVEVTSYFEADTREKEMELFEQAVVDGNTVIFSTSARLVGTSMKYALDHPKIKILNCSLNTNSRYIRTYYGRMYEAEFLIGALAGIISGGKPLEYIADYPVYGTIAGINAYALGAKMVNPDIKVYLKWAHLHSDRQDELLRDVDVALVSGRYFIRPNSDSGRFGLYDPHSEEADSLAMPVYDWGVYYEKTISSILNGTWKQEADGENESLNDWWGMSSGLIDVICSKTLPPGTVRLIKLLKSGICSGEFDPFAGMRYTKDGTHYIKVTDRLTSEQIMTMDWLADNVVGFIPVMDELSEDARTMVEVQGVDKVKD